MKSGKAIPSIMNYMTVAPLSVGSDQNIDEAHKIMQGNRIRHLPVMTAGKISGMISDRDIKLALSLRGVDSSKTKIEEISSSDVFIVKSDAKLDDVVKTMADKKVGSVLIVDNNKLVGIFTTIDALMALHELLQTRLA